MNRKCPVCEAPMRQEIKFNVVIDTCDEHGVWLDNGELEKMLLNIDRIRSQMKQREDEIGEAEKRGKIQGALGGFWSLLR